MQIGKSVQTTNSLSEEEARAPNLRHIDVGHELSGVVGAGKLLPLSGGPERAYRQNSFPESDNQTRYLVLVSFGHSSTRSLLPSWPLLDKTTFTIV
jgi:hypothetical protein